ncbi:MAG: radical SAM protein, partial [Planctomycetota bacterium]
MLRISQLIRQTLAGAPVRQIESRILIWNLTLGCNLFCAHCYASAKKRHPQELTFEECLDVIRQLPKVGVKFVILSGGEPLMHPHLFELAEILRKEKIGTYLSTNGLLINDKNLPLIKQHFLYVGISIDGPPEIHDRFRGRDGAFERSLANIRRCLKAPIPVGIRFTLTRQTSSYLPFVFELAEREGIPKIYISHLVFAGRGASLQVLSPPEIKEKMAFVLEKAFEYQEKKIPIEIVTGNNETDAVYLFQEFSRRYPHLCSSLWQRLLIRQGNQAGNRLMNLDALGNLKADPFFPEAIGNIRENSLADLWFGSHPLLENLRKFPRKVKGKCETCSYMKICNGNSRVRAFAENDDYQAFDGCCYISSLSSDSFVPQDLESPSLLWSEKEG